MKKYDNDNLWAIAIWGTIIVLAVPFAIYMKVLELRILLWLIGR